VLVGVIALDDGELAVLGVLEGCRQVLEQRRDRAAFRAVELGAVAVLRNDVRALGVSRGVRRAGGVAWTPSFLPSSIADGLDVGADGDEQRLLRVVVGVR